MAEFAVSDFDSPLATGCPRGEALWHRLRVDPARGFFVVLALLVVRPAVIFSQFVRGKRVGFSSI